MIRTMLRFSASVVDGGVAVVSAVGGTGADGLRWLAERGEKDSSAPASDDARGDEPGSPEG